jgi:hypothetical protein
MLLRRKIEKQKESVNGDSAKCKVPVDIQPQMV